MNVQIFYLDCCEKKYEIREYFCGAGIAHVIHLFSKTSGCHNVNQSWLKYLKPRVSLSKRFLFKKINSTNEKMNFHFPKNERHLFAKNEQF